MAEEAHGDTGQRPGSADSIFDSTIHPEIDQACPPEVERTRTLLLLLRQHKAISTSWYSRLAVLENGDIGYHNGDPLQVQSNTSSSSWKDIFVALDRKPPTWHVNWTITANKLRNTNWVTVSLKVFQAELRSAKEKHLEDLEKYLALIQPWNQGDNHTPPEWTDFQSLSKELLKWLPTLFGIRSYVADSNSPSVKRSWQADDFRNDRGIKEDMCRLQGGAKAAAALECLMLGQGSPGQGQKDSVARD